MGTVHPDVQHFFPLHIFIFGSTGSLLLLRLLSSCSRRGRGGGVYSPVSVLQLLTVVPSLVRSTGSRHAGFRSTARGLRSCGLHALEQWLSTCVAQG